MAAAIALRNDYNSEQLRALARHSVDADQVRRLLALALVYEGGPRSEGARAGGVGLQTFRDWVLRSNAAGPEGLVNSKAPGQAPRLDQAQRGELAQLIDDGPIPAVHGVVRWPLSDLAEWVMETYGTSISGQTLSRYLRGMGYRRLSAWPRHHVQNPDAVVAFKKVPSTEWRRSRHAMLWPSREVWFADEARIGQKNQIARRWARRGTRPSAPSDQRTASTYIFGPSARYVGLEPHLYCHGATAPQWPCI